MTSLTHMGDLIGRKRNMAQSAIGYILITHSDPSGRNRLNGYGSIYFDIDQQSDWDDLVENDSASYVERNALTPWMSSVPYVIPRGTIFKSAKGIEFISLESMEIRQLTEPYSAIKASESKLYDFIKAGGWNGIKYLKVPVIQGTPSFIMLGIAKGSRFESFIIDSSTVEAGVNSISETYFNIFVTPTVGGIDIRQESWEQIENIRLAGPYDKVYEVKYLSETNRVLIKFGDGITGQMLPPYSKITCEYLDTKGDAGNVKERFQINTMILPDGQSQVDPRTNRQEEFLSITNTIPIMGGKDIEDEADFKVNAPPSYLQSYTIATINAYREQIFKRTPVSLLHLKIFQSKIIEATSYGAGNGEYVSSIENSVLQEITKSKNALVICAIKANGTKFDDPESELILPIIKSLSDKKSPNDTFQYLEPNFIQMRPNIIIGTRETIPETEVKDIVKPAILNEYSIFNTNFEKPYYSSKINDVASNFAFTEYVNSFVEAKANVDMQPVILSTSNAMPAELLTDGETMLAFKFNFDEIFAKNKETAGFKNFKSKAQYVIRADIQFKDDPTLDKSFFLFDNRINTAETPTLLDAEGLQINKDVKIPSVVKVTYPGFGDYLKYDEIDDLFYNRQTRTAQFPFIGKITSDNYCLRMKLFNVEPYEIRPFYVDEFGKKKQFKIETVPEDEQVSLTLTGTVSGNYCFRKNNQFYDNSKIIFFENYENPEDPQYATGYVVVPLARIINPIDAEILAQIIGVSDSLTELGNEIKKLITERITVNVWAQPIIQDYKTIYPNDIIFTDKNDVLIEKLLII
jgi:hypothetical protein